MWAAVIWVRASSPPLSALAPLSSWVLEALAVQTGISKQRAWQIRLLLLIRNRTTIPRLESVQTGLYLWIGGGALWSKIETNRQNSRPIIHCPTSKWVSAAKLVNELARRVVRSKQYERTDERVAQYVQVNAVTFKNGSKLKKMTALLTSRLGRWKEPRGKALFSWFKIEDSKKSVARMNYYISTLRL